MIHHLSIAAREVMHVAEVLAELMRGTVVPYPPKPGCITAAACDEHGTSIEIYPAGSELRPDVEGTLPSEGAMRAAFSATHFALSVTLSPEEVEAIARREGWKCVTYNRGGNFRAMVVWIENTTMMEILPPAYAREYLDFTKTWGGRVASKRSTA